MPPMTKARPKSADAYVGNTKPIRSSPLAGPALNRSLATPVLTVSSNEPTDPLLTVTTPPICHVLHPKFSQNLDSCDSCSSTPTTSRRRGLGPITAGSARSQSLYIPSRSSSDSGHASPSLKSPASEWEIDPLQSLSISRTPLRPRPSTGIASFRPPIPIVEEEPEWQVEETDATDSSSKDTSCNSSTSEFTKSQPSSQPHINSWYTANTYDVTPRFSRLGLSASTVVMPLSPKEHRRLSRNTSITKTNSSSSSSSTTSLPTKRFFIPTLSSKPFTPATPTLQPPQPLPSQTSPKRQPLSRTFSSTSSSETSSITSNSQCETPTPISTSTSSPSLTRSRSSEDSISTWYESLPPTTPHLEHMTLPTENDGGEYKRDKEAVDGEVGAVGEFRGHHDRDGDHGQIHYSDITITIKSASDDETRPDQVLMKTERLDLQSQPKPQPAPQPTTNSPYQIPTFPKDVKKERGSLRKKLVRIKLQPFHNVYDLEDDSPSFSTLKIKTMTTMRLTTPITRAAEVGEKVAVGLPELPVPVVLPATVSVPVAVINSEDTFLSTSSISLPISTSMKKRPTLKSVFKKFIARW